MRLDAGIRVGPTNDTLSVNIDAGGATTVTLTHGLYVSVAALCDEATTQLAAVDAALSMTISGAGIALSASGGSTAAWAWPKPALRDALGFTGVLSAAALHTSDSCPHTFLASLPWSTRRPVGWTLTRQRSRHPSGVTASRTVTRRRRFEVDAVVTAAELAAFRAVMRRLAAGVPGTLYRDADNATPWAYDEWSGQSAVQIAGPSYADAFDGRTLQLLRTTLVLLEYSA